MNTLELSQVSSKLIQNISQKKYVNLGNIHLQLRLGPIQDAIEYTTQNNQQLNNNKSIYKRRYPAKT